jgi:hypothetical protein
MGYHSIHRRDRSRGRSNRRVQAHCGTGQANGDCPVDNNAKAFLDNPEVKDGLGWLSQADEKSDNCMAQLAEIEEIDDI